MKRSGWTIAVVMCGVAACDVEGGVAPVEEAEGAGFERAVYYYLNTVSNNALATDAFRCDRPIGTDDALLVHEIEIDQAMYDQMWASVDGTLQVEFTQRTAFSFVGNGAGSHDVRVQVFVGLDQIAEIDESRAGPPSGTFQATRVVPITEQHMLDVVDVGDILQVKAFGSGIAVSGGCSNFDQAIVAWYYTNGGLPFLRTIP